MGTSFFCVWGEKFIKSGSRTDFLDLTDEAQEREV